MLAQLMAADGFDSGFGHIGELAWRAYVATIQHRLGIEPSTSVYEVGCGAGAFLFPLFEMGCGVAGLDGSAALLGYAADAMPGIVTHLADASALAEEPAFDFVVSSGVFLYFPSLDYAGDVLTRMARKAVRGVAVLDVPDVATRDEAEQMRRQTMGPGEYEARYRGLQHLYFQRGWFEDTLRAAGWPAVTIAQQDIAGYRNGRYRFNVFATRQRRP